MITSIITLCAQGVVIDTETNNVSIFNLLEEIHGNEFPLFFPRIDFFTLLTRKEEDPKVINTTLSIVNNKNELTTIKYSINFGNKLRIRLRLGIAGLLINTTGKLKFILKKDNKKICSYDIKVSTIKPKIEPKKI